ncbi:hypothetical protein [Couchioplanes caeruleus]|uniref:Uncharacterized protein n=1 Tax=Couchioplanes caeruleus TaxID=56438 RepID=A0A3N1GEB3_9ACTN|nr:hypothetical protein [Couchioplanes caeruleus]ROP28535.1 hypothetical protein EDD30_1299 [Couchioplanes caeruleus]
MKKPVLIGLLIAAALLALIGVGGTAGGHHRGDAGDSRQATPPMDCIQTSCG